MEPILIFRLFLFLAQMHSPLKRAFPARRPGGTAEAADDGLFQISRLYFYDLLGHMAVSTI